MKQFIIILITFGLLTACATAATLIPRIEPVKPIQPVIRDCDRWDLLVVKFREKTEIRLRNGQFLSRNNANLTEIHDLIRDYPLTRVAPLFSRSESIYEAEKLSGELRTGRELADLNLYFAFGPPDRQTAEQLLADLNRLDIVECAYPEPIPQLPSLPSGSPRAPLTPPSYVENQHYMDASPVGVDVAAARMLDGGRGENVQMIDVELAWVWTHGDLPDPFFQGGVQNPDQSYRDHGTAVMGEIAGIENSFGTTGIAPLASVGGQAIDIGAWPENVGTYFDQASAALDPGDVWLIELHAPGPGGDYIPMEYWQANYDAIANSTAQGRICVEAGGNGSADLDNAVYGGLFDRSVRDSLAILVGAGTPYDMDPEWFTNYGSRMDANAWGSGIYTTGYGYLYSSEGENYYYTDDFGGTSGASPIVVGVCCLAQSIYKELTRDVLDPLTLRSAITETGAPQPQPASQYIGPRPNLEALLQHEIFDVEGIFLDQATYVCEGIAGLVVRDPDGGETVIVQITSTSDPVGETIYFEVSSHGVFPGSIALNSLPPTVGDEAVSVNHGDTLTVYYADLSATDTASIDCQGPVISDLEVADLGDTYMRITWTTDEPATSIVRYGPTTPDQTVEDSLSVTNHSILIDELVGCTHYIFSVESADPSGNLTVDDNGGTFYGIMTWERTLFLEETLDTDPGWTISGGQWAYGQPTGQGGAYGSPDPTTGYTGSNVIGYNLNGDYASNLPEYHITTTAIDMSEAEGSILSFQRWLGVEQSSYDHAYVRISTDGSTWHDIWTNASTLSDDAWTYVEYDISEWADAQPTVFLRWTMGTTDYGWEYCGWNIDDIRISSLQPCEEATPTPGPTITATPECIHHGDVNASGDITAGDAQLAFQIALGQYSPTVTEACAADCNDDGDITAGDAQAIFLAVLGTGSCVDPL